MDGEIIFHILQHTYFMDCRLFTNSLLEREFESRVVWVLHGWWNHFPYITYLFHGLQIIYKFITWKRIWIKSSFGITCMVKSFPYITYLFHGLQNIYKFITWKRICIKSSLGITWMVKSFFIYYIPISWTADYLQIHYLKKNLDQE